MEQSDHETLTSAVVDTVVDDAGQALLEERVRAPGTHQRVLYQIIADAGEIDAGTLHARYEAESTPRNPSPADGGISRVSNSAS